MFKPRFHLPAGKGLFDGRQAQDNAQDGSQRAVQTCLLVKDTIGRVPMMERCRMGVLFNRVAGVDAVIAELLQHATDELTHADLVANRIAAGLATAVAGLFWRARIELTLRRWHQRYQQP